MIFDTTKSSNTDTSQMPCDPLEFAFKIDKNNPHTAIPMIRTPSSTATPKHNYHDPDIYYVNRDFFARSDGQLSVFIDDELDIIEEVANSSWTLVRERDSLKSGLIPTDILESGPERLAQENKTRNQETIRLKLLDCKSGRKKNTKSHKSCRSESVRFSKSDPEIFYIETKLDEMSLNFPYNAQTHEEAISLADDNGEEFTPKQDFTEYDDHTVVNRTGFFKNIFKRNPSSKSSNDLAVLNVLKDFERYSDHLIRVYTGNFDPILNGFKTFIIDESVQFHHFTALVLENFDLLHDGFEYEINLVNHLNAQVIPIDLEQTIAEIIEISKREALEFVAKMPKQLKKVQGKAIKRFQKTSLIHTERDKSTDYVTPFKFVLNRIIRSNDSVPIWVHVRLATGNENPHSTSTTTAPSALILSSLFADISSTSTQSSNHSFTLQYNNGTSKKRKSKWWKSLSLFGKKQSSASLRSFGDEDFNLTERIQIDSSDSIHFLIHILLEHLQVPQNLPNIAFEAFLPAIQDTTIELPLPMEMSVGDALKIRTKIDQSQQMILIRPVIL